MNFAWIFNSDEYSLMALLDQTARQESSGGSWIVGVNLAQTEMRGNSPFIPTSVQSQFGDDATLSQGIFKTASATVGYGYTWVWSKKFYFGLMLLGGTGIQQRTLTKDSGVVSESARVEKSDLRLGFGYNGDRFFLGVHANFNGTTFKTNSLKIQHQLINGQWFFGTRF